MRNYIAVVFNLPTGKFFWYKLPSKFKGKLKRGQRVVVPFRKEKKLGFVVEESSRRPEGKLKEVIDVFDKTSPFSDSLFELGVWMSEYYSCSLGQVLHSIFPFSFAYGEEVASDSDYLKEKSTGEAGVYLVRPGNKKFEFLLHRIKENQELQRQVLILVPEISIIPGFQEKMEKSGAKILIFHSRLSPKERYSRWLAMKRGEFDVALGTRSLVFAPFPRIGLIAVDEEESTDYKQKETPKYNLCQIATKRGELENFPVYLLSNSPSLESWYKVKKGTYRMIDFSGKQRLVSFCIVDLKKEKKENRIFSNLLQQKIKEALEKKRPVVLFVPRRGYASFLLCSDCGEIIRCPNCNIGLSFHLKEGMLCHWCGFQERPPRVCPFCDGRGLKKVGWGTQRVELEAKRNFPEARIQRFDLDIFKSSAHLIPSRIENREVDILVGTQLLIKEEILSLVDVVGIILVDVLLNLPDFRATEHTFHLLHKIRRSLNKKGALIVQTYNPTHYVLRAKTDEDFYSEELKIRKTLGYPPFQRWIRLLFEGRTKNKVKDKSNQVARELEKEDVNFLGPSPCPFFKIKGKYRYHIILRDDNTGSLQDVVKKINSQMMRGTVKMGIDVDPLVTM